MGQKYISVKEKQCVGGRSRWVSLKNTDSALILGDITVKVAFDRQYHRFCCCVVHSVCFWFCGVMSVQRGAAEFVRPCSPLEILPI